MLEEDTLTLGKYPHLVVTIEVNKQKKFKLSDANFFSN